MGLLKKVMLSAPLFAAIASAQILEFTSFPPNNTYLDVPFVVNYQAPNNEVVTIVLLQGPAPLALTSSTTLAITSGSSYTWTPNAVPTSFYALRINDANTANYGNAFTIVEAQQPASGVGAGAAPVTTSSSASIPTTGTSSFTASAPTTTGPVVIAPGPAVTSPTTTMSSMSGTNFVTNLPSMTSSTSMAMSGNYSATTVTVEDCSCTDMDSSTTMSTSVTPAPWSNGTATSSMMMSATPASNTTVSMATIPATTAGLVASSTWTVVPATGGAVSRPGGCGMAVLGMAMMVAVAAMW